MVARVHSYPDAMASMARFVAHYAATHFVAELRFAAAALRPLEVVQFFAVAVQ